MVGSGGSAGFKVTLLLLWRVLLLCRATTSRSSGAPPVVVARVVVEHVVVVATHEPQHHQRTHRLFRPAALTATLIARNAIGFATLYAATSLARRISTPLEARLIKSTPAKPWLPHLMRHTLSFATAGATTSLGVPLLFLRLGL